MKTIYENAVTRDALVYAAMMHEGQERKYTGEAYITHPVAVAEMLLSYGIEDPDMHAAALLHDVIEDTPAEYEDVVGKFGRVIGGMVRDLTKLELPGLNRAKRKGIEAVRLAQVSEKVQTIKYADLLHNADSIMLHDLKFAKVFMKEMEVLHDEMDKGNSGLRGRMKYILDGWKKVKGSR